MKEQFTAYVTKYGLTEGILEVDASWDEQWPDMISFRTEGSSFRQHAHRNDWWRDLESAEARVDVMRTKKIASLHKSIEKMMALKVKVKKC